MSVQAITCALALRGVSSSEKLLLLALANYADEHMRCHPSQARLAGDTCLSDRTVRALLAALEERKLISRIERRRPDGSRSSDGITLHFAGEVVTKQPETISGGPAPVSGGVRKPLPGGAEIASGLTTFEPSLNHKSGPKPKLDGPGVLRLAEQIRTLPPQKFRHSGTPAIARSLAPLIAEHDPADLLAACRAFYALPDQQDGFVLSVVKFFDGGRFRDFLPGPDPPPIQITPATRARLEQHYADTGEWKPTWGPKPVIHQ